MIRFYRIFFFIFVLYVAAADAPAQPAVLKAGKEPLTAIVGAMESEVELLKARLSQPSDTIIEGIRFFSGRLQEHPVVITRSGVGKVNAAIVTMLLLEHFRPAQLLFSGIAGGLNPVLQPGDVVVATAVAYHDYGRKYPDSMIVWPTRNPSDLSFNPVNFRCDSVLLVRAKTATENTKLQAIGNNHPTVHFGLILTGDLFLSDSGLGGQLRKRTGADAIEMEGAAVAQVCYQQHTPFLIIRSLSDNADHTAEIDFKRNGKIAAENSAEIILELLKKI